MENFIESIVKALGIIMLAVIIIVFISILFAFPTMWLWNWLMPVIFGLPKITIWKALGLNFLFAILFKGNTISTNKK
jgi:uncharacterized protein YqfA (UPF0365 family)